MKNKILYEKMYIGQFIIIFLFVCYMAYVFFNELLFKFGIERVFEARGRAWVLFILFTVFFYRSIPMLTRVLLNRGIAFELEKNSIIINGKKNHKNDVYFSKSSILLNPALKIYKNNGRYVATIYACLLEDDNLRNADNLRIWLESQIE